MRSLTTKIPKSMRSMNSNADRYFVEGMFRHIAHDAEGTRRTKFEYSSIANIILFRKVTGTPYTTFDLLGADGNIIGDYARTVFQIVEIYNKYKDDFVYVSSGILVNVRYVRYIRQHPEKKHRRSIVLSVGDYGDLPISTSMFDELSERYPIKVEDYPLKQFKYVTCKPTEQPIIASMELKPISRRRLT